MTIFNCTQCSGTHDNLEGSCPYDIGYELKQLSKGTHPPGFAISPELAGKIIRHLLLPFNRDARIQAMLEAGTCYHIHINGEMKPGCGCPDAPPVGQKDTCKDLHVNPPYYSTYCNLEEGHKGNHQYWEKVLREEWE